MKLFTLSLFVVQASLLAANPFQPGGPDAPQKTSVATFSTTRIVNGHSVETLWGRQLDFRVTHRFGDMATKNANTTLFGLDNSTDIRIALEYGITNKLNIGLGRCKGAGPQTRIIDGYIKYNFLQQTEDKSVPLSITLLGTSSYTNMKASTDSTSPVAFYDGVQSQRLSYCTQLIIARKFHDRFAMQLSPTYIHRNFVAFDDANDLFSIGISMRLKLTKVFSLLGEYYLNFPTKRVINGQQYYNPLGIGFEWNTGGHVFHVNICNSAGLGETQFIPYTFSNINNGSFRLGFNISRVFKF